MIQNIGRKCAAFSLCINNAQNLKFPVEVIELRSTLKLLEQSLIPSTSQPVPPDEVMEEPEPTNADDESKVKLASLLKAQDEQKKRRSRP